MEAQGYANIFISYSHNDRPWMEVFRKELKAALYEKARVWCDEDIVGGTDWKGSLAKELRCADVVLILATSDYLISPWCRKELQYIDHKFREKKIKNVFWVQLKPCAWERTELAAFQCRPSVLRNALSEIQGEIAREREIIDIVREIASGVESIAKALDPKLNFVQSIIGDQAFEKGLSIESLISDEGDFAVVCRGRNSSQQDVAIKVLRRSPISGVLENLEKTARRRKELRDPGFIQLHDGFLVKNQYGEHLVLVMEYVEGTRLSEVLKDEALKGRFTMDYIVFLLRRAAEALRELHKLESGNDNASSGIGDLGYGPMMPTHLFYDDRLERLRFSSLSISNFAWDLLGWRKFTAWVDSKSARYVAPEHTCKTPPAIIDKRKVDQYMLGQLALEMLDGKLPVEGDGPSDIDLKKEEFFRNPLKNAGQWKYRHCQLEKIISKMLDRKPNNRWGNMGEVVTQLKSVEDEGRALAKSGYMRWIDHDNDTKFFEEFYTHFFESKVAKERKSHTKFEDHEQQYEKLKKAMAAVLNYNHGNEPTSLRYVVNVHKDKCVKEDELEQFKSSFLKVLQDRLDKVVPPDEMAGKKQEVYEAWKHLFNQVLQYFKDELLKSEGNNG